MKTLLPLALLSFAVVITGCDDLPKANDASPMTQPTPSATPSQTPAIEIPSADTLSQKSSSRTVTAAMRAHAIANVEKYDWAARRKAALETKLADYLAADDDFLWNLLPSQDMPRTLYSNILDTPGMEEKLLDPKGWTEVSIKPSTVGPPGAEQRHFSKPQERSGGWGTPFYYRIDPFRHPWKVQCVGTDEWYPKNDFAAFYQSALDDDGRYDARRGDPKFLISEGPAGTGTWVDNGAGMLTEGGYRFVFAMHYAFRVWQQAIDVVRDLAELYTLTNDPQVARKAGLLMARMADWYPELVYTQTLGSPGAPRTGGAQDYIWESWTAQRLSLAYDQIFDALAVDETLAEFVATKEGFDPKKFPPRALAKRIEDRILREFVRRIEERCIAGNPGMHQYAMAAAAIALDDPTNTPGWLDWIFSPEGGELPNVLVDQLSRDGLGHEAGIGYASIPPRSFFEIARLLNKYPEYEGSDLFAQYPKFANALQGSEANRLHKGSMAHVGDGGAAFRMSEVGYAMPPEMALEGFQRFGSAGARNVLIASTQGDSIRLPRDIYAPDPEAAVEEAVAALADKPALTPRPSYNSGGYGLAVLQATNPENPRAVAVNYGPMGKGHGHGDRLGLHLLSHGRYLATDLGYPTHADYSPERLAWVSHTVSHNTVMVDESNMISNSSLSGKTLLFAEADGVGILEIDGGGERTLRGMDHYGLSNDTLASHPPQRIYPGVSVYRRAVISVDVDSANSYYLDIFEVFGGHTHRLIQNGVGLGWADNGVNWKAQATGTLAGPDVPFGKGEPAPTWNQRGTGFQFLRDVSRANPKAPFWVEWSGEFGKEPAPDDPLRFRLHNLTEIDEAVQAIGEAPANHTPIRYLHRVRKGTPGIALRSQFLTVLEPYTKTPLIRQIRRLDDAKTSGLILEVALTDGRTDRLYFTPEPDGIVGNPQIGELTGRFAWVRLDSKGQMTDGRLIDATSFQFAGQQWAKPDQPSVFHGEVIAIDPADPQHVRVQTSLTALPETLAGKYIVIDNHQRADASYLINAVLPGGVLDIGAAAIDEQHVDKSDYSKGRIPNIREGETFRIANPVFIAPSADSR